MNRFIKRIAILGMLIAIVGGCQMEKDKGLNMNHLTELDHFIDETLFYNNPIGISQIGDPFILKASNGMYYCYATSDGDYGYKVWYSEDMVNWKVHSMKAYSKKRDSWGIKDFWAPEVYEWSGKYYMYYSARWKENDSLRIGVAVSDSPLGPFVDISNEPLFDYGYAVIDAHVFVDEDQKAYLFYSRDCSENTVGIYHESHCYGVELSEDRLSVIGEPILLTKPEQKWETRSGSYRWNEGPYVIRHQDKYILSYSANCYADRSYSIGYAVSDNPLGPYKKTTNRPLLYAQEDWKKISGTGHHMLMKIPDTELYYIIYHGHTIASIGGGDRSLYIDILGFREDETLFVTGPKVSNQLKPLVYEEALKLESYYNIYMKNSEITSLSDHEIALYDDVKVTKIQHFTNDDVLDIQFDEPKEVSAVIIYDGINKDKLNTISIEFSNGYAIPSLTFSDSSDEPAIACFESMEIEWIKIRNEGSTGGLSELIIVPKIK